MARTGVYFSDVKRARDSLIAKGRRPSIDAVRAELGDTGSKTTIHKYLRELDAEKSTQVAPVSDAIQALITQLAEQLRAEADVVVQGIREQLVLERGQHKQEIATGRTLLAEAQQRNLAITDELNGVREQLDATQQRVHEEQIARHTAEQRSADLAERMVDAQRHQASLEDKHKQAREALDHFRTASKEQRDQEVRGHEHQIQSLQAQLREAQQSSALKQEQLTQLNKESASLVADLRTVKHALYSEKEFGHSLARKVEHLHAVESRAAMAEAQAASNQARAVAAEDALVKANQHCGELRQQLAGLEAQLKSMHDTSMLEQRIAKLQQAVFGTDAPKPIKASQPRPVAEGESD
ncbi:DNA-binding protein [Massilia sp. NP310]|jgi:chromosome segregation ATPase|uniref:DNA-binding protein n=1 Tax=Massilia sp. NP310 TaxID=2861282 RepID=UPI001C629B55|nr:DNA-binding protein [Massilia sp. NP310]QYG02798.1 DNA-binding protein [Massilia sp. NP310]